MKGLLGSFVLLIAIAVFFLLLADLLLFLGYMVVVIYRKCVKSDHIKACEALPDGTVFQKKNNSVRDICEYLEDILTLYENPAQKETKYRMGANLYQRVENAREILKKNEMLRKIRFVDVNVEKTDRGKVFRKWDQGGKEWRAGELYAVMTEQFVEKGSGTPLSLHYYPSVKISSSMSRRLKAEDKANASHKDKWGRKIENRAEFYKAEQLRFCSSCGAELPNELKDVVCPYCGSTIFSDYYDWQVETLDIEPQKMKLKGIIGWLIYFKNHRAISSGVKNKKKRKIVRFSENDFRQDVYESFLKDGRADELLDMRLGTIDIRSVKNTEKDTLLGIQVPVYRAVLVNKGTGNIAVRNDLRDVRAVFTRARYPDRFRKDDAVVSKEKACPACGGAFAPDAQGNCRFCGTFLFKDNVKWKRV